MSGRHESAAQPHPLAGFGHLLRFLIRRDRLRAPVWILSVVGIVAASTSSVVSLYATPEQLQQYETLATSNVAIKAITGPGFGLDDPTQGAVVMNEMEMFTFIMVALLSIFMVTRHTRAEEETDRAELVRSGPVGRYANLAATCTWVAVIDVVVAVGLFAAMLGFDLGGTGTAAFALATLGVGLVFLGVAAVTAQMGTTGRAANSAAGAVLGGAFLLRAVGDMGNGWISWLSPLGWAQRIHAFDGEQWWVLGLLAGATVALVVGAVVLTSRRDLGAGFLKQKAGPSHGDPRLASPLALAARLQRTSLIGWTVGMAIMGFFFGIVSDQADEILENQAVAEVLAQAGSGTPTESFLATIVLMTGVIASGFTISAVLRLRTEELNGRVEPMLAAPVSRVRWLGSYLVVSLVGSTVIMLASGATIGLGYTLVIGEAGELGPVLAASAVMVPALWVLASFTAALVGVHVRWGVVAWVGVVISAVVAFLAESLNLPQWVRDLSPFQHVPAMPAASFDIVPVALLIAVSAVLCGVGAVGMRHRDIG